MMAEEASSAYLLDEGEEEMVPRDETSSERHEAPVPAVGRKPMWVLSFCFALALGLPCALFVLIFCIMVFDYDSCEEDEEAQLNTDGKEKLVHPPNMLPALDKPKSTELALSARC